MGLIDIDDVVGTVINKAGEKLEGTEKEEKTTFGAAVLRFFVSLIWVIITLVVSILALYAMAAGATGEMFGIENAEVLCYVAIALCVIFFLVTFLVPYLRKKGTMTRWCGIVLLLDACWWIYLMITGFN